MGSGLFISILGKLNVRITVVPLMQEWNGLPLTKKSSFKMLLQLPFSVNLNFSSYIVSIAITVSKNIVALICSMFLSSEPILSLF